MQALFGNKHHRTTSLHRPSFSRQPQEHQNVNINKTSTNENKKSVTDKYIVFAVVVARLGVDVSNMFIDTVSNIYQINRGLNDIGSGSGIFSLTFVVKLCLGDFCQGKGTFLLARLNMMDWGICWMCLAYLFVCTVALISPGNSYERRLSQLVAPSIAPDSIEIAAWAPQKMCF